MSNRLIYKFFILFFLLFLPKPLLFSQEIGRVEKGLIFQPRKGEKKMIRRIKKKSGTPKRKNNLKVSGNKNFPKLSKENDSQSKDFSIIPASPSKNGVLTKFGLMDPDSLKIVVLDVNKHPLPVSGFNYKENSLYLNFKSSLKDKQDSLAMRFEIKSMKPVFSPGTLYHGDIASFVGNVFTLFIPYRNRQKEQEKLDRIRKIYLSPDTTDIYTIQPKF